MKFKVTVSQWPQEMAERVFEAEDRQDAIDKALKWNEDSGDWDWQDGDSVRDFEVIEAEELEPLELDETNRIEAAVRETEVESIKIEGDNMVLHLDSGCILRIGITPWDEHNQPELDVQLETPRGEIIR